MITFYTAVGSFEGGTGICGIRRPVLIKSGRKHNVTLPQFVLWSSLLWNIHNYDEIKAIYEKKMVETQIKGSPPFDETLKDMIGRGLIAAGRGYSGVDALYELLSTMFLVPVHTPLWERICGFFYLIFLRRIPLRIAMRLFGKPPLAPQERAAWALITQRTMLSTAELIRCTELGVSDVSTGAKIVESLYGAGDGVGHANVNTHSRFSDKRTVVIDAVANLYLKKQILFECC
jgi:hypothetical protein